MGLGTAAVLLALFGASSARAAVYPAGGGAFNGSAEGWAATEATCNVPVLCTASGGYDGGAGNPAGSLAANANVALNLLSLFKSTVVLESPDFTATEGGSYILRVDRQFSQGDVIELAPQLAYTVSLLNRTNGTEAKAVTETLTESSAFAGRDAAVSLLAGHTYAVRIVAETSSTVVGLGLLAGATTARFDNVSLSRGSGSGSGGGGGVGGGGGAGDGAGGAGGGLTNQRLLAAIGSNLVAPAVLKGKRLTVKARCPAAIGRPCRLTLQGMLKKRRPATNRRVTRIAQGKAKRVVLKVKPKARAKLVNRKRLLFKQTVKAGPAKATAYKRLKLVRR